MKLTFLGTGTSYGVPYVACDCSVCTSDDPNNKRLRSSILVQAGETRILVDTTPDVRQQLLRAHVDFISAVLWTHAHNDHIIGVDDLRPLSDRQGYIPGYANADTIAHLRHVFEYVFVEGREHGGFPRVAPQVLSSFETFAIGQITVTALPIFHGQREIFAYRFECAGRVLVYSTDCSFIPDETKAAMRKANVLVLDALRHREHHAHFTVEQAVRAVEELSPRQALFTHIAHDLDHHATDADLPLHVSMAYDMMEIEI
jgi:phosphoribosyl 1,2-cyclic phosphate phosphodiesterase